MNKKKIAFILAIMLSANLIYSTDVLADNKKESKNTTKVYEKNVEVLNKESKGTLLIPSYMTIYEDQEILSAVIQEIEKINSTKINSYSIRLSQFGNRASVSVAVSDIYGNDGSGVVSVTIRERPKPPQIIVSDMVIELGESFNPMKDVKAYDEYDGDITYRIEIISNDVNTKKVGTYKVVYKVTDSDGLSDSKTRIVRVKKGNEPTILATDKVLKIGDSFDPMSGIEAKDKEDGDITKKIKIIKNTVNMQKVGDYVIIYEVEDNDSNKITKEIKVKVKSNDKPVIVVKDISMNFGDKFNPLDIVKATDKEDGDITSKIIVKSNNVNTSKLGDYKVIYEVTDSDGNKVSKTINVNVKLAKSDFTDHWGQYEINKAMKNGWINTTENFRPNDSITRAEFVKIVNKAFGFWEKGNENFVDVNSQDWYYNEVKIAMKAGYISANNKNFRPNDSITREEVANIITSIKKCKDSNLDKLNKYIDKDKVSSWAKSSVEGAIEKGYMGKGSNKFRPKDSITRAESVVTLSRIK